MITVFGLPPVAFWAIEILLMISCFMLGYKLARRFEIQIIEVTYEGEDD